MRIATFAAPALCAALALPLLSCGDKELPPTADAGDYFPLAVGDYWLYQESDASGPTGDMRYEVKEQVEHDFQYDEAGPLSVFLLETTFPSGTSADTDTVGGWRVEYLRDDGTRVARLRQDVYDATDTLTKTRDYVPGFLRFDRSQVTVGAQWEETFKRHSDSTPENTGDAIVTEDISYLYEILEPETVSVPAGEFDCTVVQRTVTMGASFEIKVYYFAPGVGKVKEVTGDSIEELVEYHVEAGADGGA
jgi:hypothetical protein